MDEKFITVFRELKNFGVKVSKAKRLKCTHQKQKYISSKTPKGVFGVNLCDQEWIAVGEDYLPRFLVLTTTFLQDHLDEIGLFRKAGSVSRQRKLKEKINRGSNLEDAGPHDVASILKQWLRELPESLLPSYLQDIFLKCLQLENADHQISASLLTCLLLPPERLLTLKYLLQFLASVAACESTNKMNIYNISVVLAPSFFVYEVNKPNTSIQFVPVLQLLIQNADKVGDTSLLDMQNSSQNLKNASQLGTSADFLSSSPKRKGVQDVLNGIRKFVGQGTSPSKLRQTPRSPQNVSTYKRKGDPVTPLTPAKKSKEETCLKASPELKASVKEDKIKPGRTRRKTFDLLRRKNKNKFKNSKTLTLQNTTESVDGTSATVDANENGKPSPLPSKVLAETEVPQVISFVPSLRFSFEKTDVEPVSLTNFVASATSSTSVLPEQNLLSPHFLKSEKLTCFSESSVEIIASSAEITPMSEVSMERPVKEVVITKLTTIDTGKKHNYSSRKPSNITRQDAFIFRRNSTISKSDYINQLSKKGASNTTANKINRHNKSHKTMPLNKTAPPPKQVSNSKPVDHVKRASTIARSLDFRPKNMESIDFKEIDSALTFDFDKLALSPPSDTAKEQSEQPPEEEEDSVFDLPIILTEFVGTPDHSSRNVERKNAIPPEKRNNGNVCSVRKMSSGNQLRTPISKIPRLGSTGSISNSNNSELRRNSKFRRSAGSNKNFSPSSNCSGFSDINVSGYMGLDASCCKTPGGYGNDTIQWINASKFLSAEMPRDTAEPNKRESIAMILRNKGHVKNKISMYDVQNRQSMHASRSCSTPLESEPPKRQSHTARPSKQDFGITKNHESVRRQQNKSSRRSPVIPKFVLPGVETPPSQSLHTSNNSTRNSPRTITPIKEEENPKTDLKSTSFHEQVLQDTTNHLFRRSSTPSKLNWIQKSSPDIKIRSRNSTPVKNQFNIFEDFDTLSPLMKNLVLSPMKENLAVISPMKENLLSPKNVPRKTPRKCKGKRHSSFSTASAMARRGRKKVLRSKSSPGKKTIVRKKALLDSRH